MRRKSWAAALIGGSLLTAGATLTAGVAWAGGDDATTTLRIITTEEPSGTAQPAAGTSGERTAGRDCPEKDGTGTEGGTGEATPDESAANL